MSSHIGGPLADCFEVVVRDYKIIGDQVNIEFVRVKEGMPEPQIVASFLDDAGTVIETSPLDVNRCGNDLRFLLANKVGESSTIAFAIGNISPTQVRFDVTTEEEEYHATTSTAPRAAQPEAAADDSLSVSIEDLVNEQADVVMSVIDDEDDDEDMDEDDDEDDDEDEDDEEITPSGRSSSDSKKWDKILDDYESYVDQYIKLAKKAHNGDIEAIAEYAEMMEKAEKLEKELDKAKNDLSTAQLQRMTKITQKMTKAAMQGF